MFDALVIVTYLGWPGLLVGGASGAFIAKKRKVWWAIGLAAIGLIACILIRIWLAF